MKIKSLSLALAVAITAIGAVSCKKDKPNPDPNTGEVVHDKVAFLKLKFAANGLAFNSPSLYNVTSDVEKKIENIYLFVYNQDWTYATHKELKLSDFEEVGGLFVVKEDRAIKVPAGNMHVFVAANISEEQSLKLRNGDPKEKLIEFANLEEAGLEARPGLVNKPMIMFAEGVQESNIEEGKVKEIKVEFERALAKIMVKVGPTIGEVPEAGVEVAGGRLTDVKVALKNFHKKAYFIKKNAGILSPLHNDDVFTNGILDNPFGSATIDPNSATHSTATSVFYATESSHHKNNPNALTRVVVSGKFVPTEFRKYEGDELVKATVTDENRGDGTFYRVLMTSGEAFYFLTTEDAEKFRASKNIIRAVDHYEGGLVLYPLQIKNKQHGNVVKRNNIYEIMVTRFVGLGRTPAQVKKDEEEAKPILQDGSISVSFSVKDWVQNGVQEEEL